MLLRYFKEQSLLFELIYFRNSFCCRIENSCSFRYKVLGHVGPLGKDRNFLSPLGWLKFLDFLSFLFILECSYSKPFHNTLNYASTGNIEEVMKFYNLGDKTLETDFLILIRHDQKIRKQAKTFYIHISTVSRGSA